MMSSPTVCHVLHSLAMGGAEVLAAALARRLRDRWRFVFACLDDIGDLGESLRDEGFSVERVGRRPGVDVGAFRRLARLWRKHDVRLVHAYQYTPFFYSVGARGGLRSSPPILFNEHGRHQPDHPRRKRIVFNRLALRRRDHVVAVGEAVRGAVIRNEGIAPERVEVIHNGVATRDDTPDPTATARLRHAIGLTDTDDLILLIGRLDYLKDHATAVRTIERVVSRRPGARLILVGEGPERSKIEETVEQHAMQSHVTLLGQRGDVRELLAAADVFLLTSRSEGIPVTLIEAMAAGLPIVSTDVGGVSEVVEDGKTALLVPTGDDEAAAAAVVRLLEEGALRERFAQVGRERAASRFSEERMHQQYEACYRRMLGM